MPGMTEDEHLAGIRKARTDRNAADAALRAAVRTAIAAEVKIGKVCHAAEWSDTYVRSVVRDSADEAS